MRRRPTRPSMTRPTRGGVNPTRPGMTRPMPTRVGTAGTPVPRGPAPKPAPVRPVMKKGGKVKKMQEGGMAAGNTQAEIEKLNQRIEMLRRQAEEQARGGFSSRGATGLGGVPGDMRALAPQGGGGGAFGGMKKGGMAKKGYHKMPNGKMMKNSAHKGMKKMAKGGSVKKGCDGVATKGKTKGRMV